MSDNRSFRINTNINKDKVVNVSISQDIDCLEILSLKINQSDAYRLHSANYGVIVGRVLANDGFGVPNAKVSVFIELDDADKQNSEITSLYPYTSLQSRDKENRRYNLLPDTGNGDCYRIVGTFPNKRLVLDNKSQLDVFDKYWKYTTVTNNAGDYMIFGVPVGVHTVHIDVDLSDIGILSQKPRDFYYKGYEENLFENSSQFKKSSNLDDLAQIISQDKSVQVYPFWGDKDNSDVIALSRCDLNVNYKFEPTCVFMGSIITDDYSNSISHTCTPSEFSGYNDRLTTTTGTIEMIRKTPEGGIEEFSIKGNELIDGDGVWCYQIPMNLDYVKTDEYGNIVPTDNPNEGIPTRTSVRFRISTNETMNEATGRHRARYLVPNNLEFNMDGTNNLKDGSDIDNCFQFGSSTPDKQFRNLYWNKVYSVKNYIPRIQTTNNAKTKYYSAIRSVNIGSTNNPYPFNKLRLHMSFNYVVLCTLLTIVFLVVARINKHIISPLREMLCILPAKLGGGKSILGIWRVPNWCPFKEMGVKCIDFTFPGVGPDGEDETYAPKCWSTTGNQLTDWKDLMDRLEQALAIEYNLVNLDFYNDWINGSLYMPLWFWRKVKKKKYLWGLFTKKAVNTFCSCDKDYSKIRLFELCAIPLKDDITPKKADNGSSPHKTKTSVKFRNGVIQEVTNKEGLNTYYYTPGVVYDKNISSYVRLYATDIILLGSFNQCDWDNIPNVVDYLPSTTANIPFITTIREQLEDEGDNGYEGIIPGDSTINDTVLGDKNGAEKSGKRGRSNLNGTQVAEITGMDWTHDTNSDTYTNGLFFDLSCGKIKTLTKTCYNVRRICELGVNLDATIYTEVPSETQNTVILDKTDADGMILYQEMDNNDARAMFATLNHNSLELSASNPTTRYQSHFLYYLYPQNFDGSMGAIAPSYSRNVSMDIQDSDYRKFRYGGYDAQLKMKNISKYNNQFPIFNNSYYFYFGLHNGKTAIDKYRKLFDGRCVNDKSTQYNAEIYKYPSDVCGSNGVIVVDLINARLPLKASLKDGFNEPLFFTKLTIDQLNPDTKERILKALQLENFPEEWHPTIFEYSLDDVETDMSNIDSNTVIFCNLSNDDYELEIEDSSENVFTEEVEVRQISSSASIRGLDLVDKYVLNSPVNNLAKCGGIEIFDINIEGNDIIPNTLSPTITIKNNNFTVSGRTVNGEVLELDCTLSFKCEVSGETDENYFIVGDEPDTIHIIELTTITLNKEKRVTTLGYKINVSKPGLYTLSMRQLCGGRPLGNVMYARTHVYNGKPFKLFVNDVDVDKAIDIDYLENTYTKNKVSWAFDAHKISTYKYKNGGKYTPDDNEKWADYMDGLEVVEPFATKPTCASINTKNITYSAITESDFNTQEVSDDITQALQMKCKDINNLFYEIYEELGEITVSIIGDTATLDTTLDETFFRKLNDLFISFSGFENDPIDDPLIESDNHLIEMNEHYSDIMAIFNSIMSKIQLLFEYKENGVKVKPVYQRTFIDIKFNEDSNFKENWKILFTIIAEIASMETTESEDEIVQRFTDYVNIDLGEYVASCNNPPGDVLKRNTLKIMGQQLKDVCNIAQGCFTTFEMSQGLEITSQGGRGIKLIRTEYPNYTIKSTPEMEIDAVVDDNRQTDVVHSIRTSNINCSVYLPNYVFPNYCTFFSPIDIRRHNEYTADDRYDCVNKLVCTEDSRYQKWYVDNPTILGNYISIVDNNGINEDNYSYQIIPDRRREQDTFPIENQMHKIIDNSTSALTNFYKFDFVDRAIDYWAYTKAPLHPKLLKKLGVDDTYKVQPIEDVTVDENNKKDLGIFIAYLYMIYRNAYDSLLSIPDANYPYEFPTLEKNETEVKRSSIYYFFRRLYRLFGEGNTTQVCAELDMLQIIFSNLGVTDFSTSNPQDSAYTAYNTYAVYVTNGSSNITDIENNFIVIDYSKYQQTTLSTIHAIYICLLDIFKLYRKYGVPNGVQYLTEENTLNMSRFDDDITKLCIDNIESNDTSYQDFKDKSDTIKNLEINSINAFVARERREVNGYMGVNIINGIAMRYLYIENPENISLTEATSLFNLVQDSLFEAKVEDIKQNFNTWFNDRKGTYNAIQYFTDDGVLIKPKDIKISDSLNTDEDWKKYLQHTLNYYTQEILETTTYDIKTISNPPTYADVINAINNFDRNNTAQYMEWFEQTYYTYVIFYNLFIDKVEEYLSYYNYSILSSAQADNTEYKYTLTNQSNEPLTKFDFNAQFSLRDSKLNDNQQVFHRFYDVEYEINNQQYHIQNYVSTKSYNEADEKISVGKMMDNKVISFNMDKKSTSPLKITYEPDRGRRIIEESQFFCEDGSGKYEPFSSDMIVVNNDDYFKAYVSSATTATYYTLNNKLDYWKNNLQQCTPLHYTNNFVPFGIDFTKSERCPYWPIHSFRICNIPYSYQSTLKVTGCSYNIENEILNIDNNFALISKTIPGEICENIMRLDYSEMFANENNLIALDKITSADAVISPDVKKHGEDDETFYSRSVTFQSARREVGTTISCTYKIYGDETSFTCLILPLVWDNVKVIDNESIYSQNYSLITESKTEDVSIQSKDTGYTYEMTPERLIRRINNDTGKSEIVSDDKLQEVVVTHKWTISVANKIALCVRKINHDMSDSSHIKVAVTDYIVDVIDGSISINNISGQIYLNSNDKKDAIITRIEIKVSAEEGNLITTSNEAHKLKLHYDEKETKYKYEINSSSVTQIENGAYFLINFAMLDYKIKLGTLRDDNNKPSAFDFTIQQANVDGILEDVIQTLTITEWKIDVISNVH